MELIHHGGHDGVTGSFMDKFVTGENAPDNPAGLQFSPLDGHLYVASIGSNEILRFDGRTGEYLDTPVSDLNRPLGIAFNDDGDGVTRVIMGPVAGKPGAIIFSTNTFDGGPELSGAGFAG